MLVTEFAKKYGFKGQDYKVAQKVYGNTDLTEEQWDQKLKKEFDYTKPINSKIEPVITEEKKEEVAETESFDENSEIADEVESTDSSEVENPERNYRKKKNRNK